MPPVSKLLMLFLEFPSRGLRQQQPQLLQLELAQLLYEP
jgi:hypothetical protein